MSENQQKHYERLMKRREKLLAEIRQCKTDAESWNQNYRKPGEEPIDTKWCDEALQFALELIPKKPKENKG